MANTIYRDSTIIRTITVGFVIQVVILFIIIYAYPIGYASYLFMFFLHSKSRGDGFVWYVNKCKPRIERA